MLSIRLLGSTEVTLDAKRLSINRRKSRALLFYLAAHAQPVNRNRLLSILWADHTPDTARGNLRSTLYNLRQSIGDHLAADADTVALTGALTVDARELAAFDFEALLHAASSQDPAQLRQQAHTCLAHYRGDLLADFDAGDIPEYEEWLTLERERLRRIAIRGYDALSRLHAQQGETAQALAAIEQALMLDPFQEDLQRSALALHQRAGDRPGAIRRFEEFRQLLDDEMGVPPMTETQALYDAIVTDAPLPAPYAEFAPSAQPSAPAVELPPSATQPLAPDVPAPESADARAHRLTPSDNHSQNRSESRSVDEARHSSRHGAPNGSGLSVPFIGRAAELAQLASWQDDRKLILIEGEPGFGKTSLVQHFLAQQAPHQHLVLSGRARELESRLPYQPVIEALRSVARAPTWPQWRAQMQLAPVWQQEIGRIVPELIAAPAGENRNAETRPTHDADASRLWESVYQWLGALAQLQPLVVFIDDLHWADTATLGLLGYLTRRMADEEMPVHLVAAGHPLRTRSTSATLIQTLTREDLLHRLTLGPLSREEVIELAQRLSPHYAHPLGNWLYRSAEGSPFIMVHLLRHAHETHLLHADGTVNIHQLPSVPVVPQTVYTLVQNRLETLSESARRILDAAVAVGREFDFEVVARVSALSDMAALDALDELRNQRLIQNVGGERFSFDHSLTREVAYREVGEVRYRLLHRRVAAALESLYPDQLDENAGLLAHHYAEGNIPAQALVYARRAGKRAAAVAAWQPAIGFYQQALELLPNDTPATTRLELATALGQAYLHAGEMQNATSTLRQVVVEAHTTPAIAILRDALPSLAEALINQAQYEEVVAIAESLQDIEDDDVRFTADFMWAAGLSVGGSDLTAATAHMIEAESRLATADDLLSQIRLAQISFELGSIDAQQGRLLRAIERFRRALELTAPLTNEEMMRCHILAQNNLAYHLHLLDDPTQAAAAREHAEIGYALAQERGFLNMNGYLLSTLGEIALAQGALDQAETYFRNGLRVAHQLTQSERIAGITANLGRLALARHQPDQARIHFETALSTAEAIVNIFLLAQIRL
ncbi:MAG: AAA family ATPase, partial [Litorilinea sp.]